MELKVTFKAWLIVLALLAAFALLFNSWTTIGISLDSPWETVLTALIISAALFVIIAFFNFLLEKIVIPHWVRTILFLVILGLLFLIPIIPSKLPVMCEIPPCGYDIAFTSVYGFISYFSSYPILFILWATIFAYPVIIFEIAAVYFLSKPAASWVEKIIAKISKKTNSS